MKPFPHHYEAYLRGGPDGVAKVFAAGLPDIEVAPPRDFDGPGDAWSPEHLFLAAIEACFLFTLRAVARASQLEFISLEADILGTVDRQHGVTRFSEIVLRPRLTVRAGDRARAVVVLEKAERACLVSASVSTPIRLAPEIADGSPRERAA